MSFITDFFKELSRRKYKENDLSDVVYALCRSNAGFCQFFLDFVFGEGVISACNSRIDREVSYATGRPDFVIWSGDKTYFIEIKIGDRSHHLAQYESQLRNLNKTNDGSFYLGYITNYDLKPEELTKEDCEVYERAKNHCKTWSEFKNHLKAAIDNPTHNSWAAGDDVAGLLAFCDSVCPKPWADEVVSNYKLRADDFKEITQCYNELDTFLRNNIDLEIEGHTIHISRYRKACRHAESIGIYFKAEDKSSNVQKLFHGLPVWGFAGWLVTKDFHPGFCITFDNIQGWGKPVFEHINKQDEKWMPYCVEATNGNLCEIFRRCFEDVFGGLIEGRFETDNGSCTMPEFFYSWRRLPLYLRQQIIPKLRCPENCRVQVVSSNESSNLTKWCGEYFSIIRSYDESEKEVAKYWLGIYFDRRKYSGKIVCEKIGCHHIPLKTEISNIEKTVAEISKLIRDEWQT